MLLQNKVGWLSKIRVFEGFWVEKWQLTVGCDGHNISAQSEDAGEVGWGGGCRVRDPSTTQASFESWLKILIAGAHLHFPTVQEQSSELRWQKLGKLAAHFNSILAVSVHYISIPCKKWSVFRRGEDHLPLNDHSNSIPWPEGKMWFEGSWTEKKIRSLPSPLIFVSTYLKIGMFVNIHNQNKLLLQIYIHYYILSYTSNQCLPVAICPGLGQ